VFERDGPTFWELAEQALSSTERGYDLLAPKFDLTPFRTPDVILERVAREIGPPESIDRALDVCCGTGAAMRFLRPLCKKEVVGVDLSRGMLREAERRLADAPGRAAVVLERADALDLPYRDEFDVATCFGAFGHILEGDEGRFVRSVYRALRPGGRFVFVTAEIPPVSSPAWWVARGFNAAIRVRNWLIKPEFIMYYLTFSLPVATRRLSQNGFSVEVRDGLFEPPFGKMVLVVGTKD
jgi:ubiquinone/menaquinone biosynthesis C-methylase UbiE